MHSFNLPTEVLFILSRSRDRFSVKRKKFMNEKKRGRQRISIIPLLQKGRKIIKTKKKFGPRPHSIITLKWDWYFIKTEKKYIAGK